LLARRPNDLRGLFLKCYDPDPTRVADAADHIRAPYPHLRSSHLREILTRMTSVNVTIDMKVGRCREMTSLARIAWDRNYEPKFERWLPNVAVPTLILWGEQDRAIPAGQAKYRLDRLPNAEVVTFPGAGHLLFFESNAAVKRLGSFSGRIS
jgi:pimeloyl-ACP methyl ester carboxylesterase